MATKDFSLSLGYLFSRSHPFDPPEMLRELRSKPISKVSLRDGTEVWLVTRHKDVVTVLRDARFSSEVGYNTFASEATKKLNAWSCTSSLGHMDGARHARIRQALAEGFLPKRIDALRPELEKVANICVDRILEMGPPLDLHEAFSMTVVGKVVPVALGMPMVYREAVDDFMDIVDSFREERSPEIEARYTAALVGLHRLCGDLLREHEETGDSLFTQIQRAVRNGQLSYDEASGVITNVTAIGHPISASSVTLSMLMLMLNPDLLRAVREKDASVSNSLEEIHRYHSPMNWGLPRVAVEDVLMDGALIKKGDELMVSLSSANRDECMFSDPDDFDVSRSDARHHVTFGSGLHVCIGQWLARAEVEIAIYTLVTRIPTLRLAVPLEEISFAEEAYIFEVEELPVTW